MKEKEQEQEQVRNKTNTDLVESVETIMPHWCSGKLAVKGTKHNIKRFLIENISAEDVQIHEDDKKLIISSKQQCLFIEGTSDDYIAGNIEFNFGTKESIEKCTINEFMAAHFIILEPYTHMSRKYDIDIDVFGIGINDGSIQEIKIQKGEIIREFFHDNIPVDQHIIDDSDALPL